MKKILVTGSNGMLAHDFIRSQGNHFQIIWLDKTGLDITDIRQTDSIILEIGPDIILNCAAYTNVDEAEDNGRKANFEINTLGVFHLAKVAKEQGIDFITLSTDYVFDGEKEGGYDENDVCNPINEYGMSKYLGEKLALEENKNSIVVRTSWLYGGIPYSPHDKGEWKGVFKNFVNTMLKLSETRTELKIINDQFWSPTYAGDLSKALGEIIKNVGNFRGKTLHLSNETPPNGVTWFDFASEIFKITGKGMNLIPCTTEEYKTKAVRPRFSKMRNNSSVKMRDWREGLREYLWK